MRDFTHWYKRNEHVYIYSANIVYETTYLIFLNNDFRLYHNQASLSRWIITVRAPVVSYGR